MEIIKIPQGQSVSFGFEITGIEIADLLDLSVNVGNQRFMLSDESSGNLRDTQNITFDFAETIGGSEVEHKMYNWCPALEIIL